MAKLYERRLKICRNVSYKDIILNKKEIYYRVVKIIRILNTSKTDFKIMHP